MLESLFNKVTGLKACIFIKNEIEHSCFPMNIARFLKTASSLLFIIYFFKIFCDDEY